jgi:hypothetical protein
MLHYDRYGRLLAVLINLNGHPLRSSFVYGIHRGLTSFMQPQSAQEIRNQAMNELDGFVFSERLGGFP